MEHFVANLSLISAAVRVTINPPQATVNIRSDDRTLTNLYDIYYMYMYTDCTGKQDVKDSVNYMHHTRYHFISTLGLNYFLFFLVCALGYLCTCYFTVQGLELDLQLQGTVNERVYLLYQWCVSCQESYLLD